jgi:hypothetical protein
LLDQPLAALGRCGFDKPVWHCVARAAPRRSGSLRFSVGTDRGRDHAPDGPGAVGRR